MKQHEKRGAPRVRYISDVECESAGLCLTARTSDISASGVFIHSKLSCEAGSILKLRFPVSSTQIEAVGEVCYSIPHIGMGVRFLELKPEYRSAIEELIENQRDQEGGDKGRAQGGRIIRSGVEPVDKLLGGLERGHLYLTHGDASGKSLFGVEFLIEGLKRGQPGALITPHRKKDALGRFVRFGYDCQEDIRSGALALYTYSYDVVEQIQARLQLEPLFWELGPTLDEYLPERIVFDPVDHLLAGPKQEHVTERANQLAVWVRSFGATVVLVASEEDREVIESLMPSVRNSFRFEVRERFDRVIRFMAFEKSPSIPDQAVRVDPSRGISLLADQTANEQSCERLGEERGEGTGVCDRDVGAEDPIDDIQLVDPQTEDQSLSDRTQTQVQDPPSLAVNVPFEDLTVATTDASVVDISPAPKSEGRALNADMNSRPPAAASDDLDLAIDPEEARDAFFAMLDELQSFASSIDPG